MRRRLACFALVIGMWSVSVFGQQSPSTSAAGPQGDPPRTQRPGGDPSAKPTGQNGEAVLTNADVIRMVKAGVPDSAIIASIHSRPAKFDVSPEALVRLHKEGVSEEILQAMTARGEAASSASGSTGGTQAGSPGNSANLKAPPVVPQPKTAIKPTAEQTKAALMKLKSAPRKLSPVITANPRTAQAETMAVAALQQQKQAVQSGRVMSATGDPAGGQSTPPGTPGGSGPGSNNPAGGGSNPNPNSPNPNNPSGGQNPTGGLPSKPSGGSSRTATASSVAVAQAPIRAAAPPSSGGSLGNMSALQRNVSIDPCNLPNLPPTVKGLNSQGYYGPAVFSQDPAYNPFWVIGCHFGNTQGRAYLNTASSQKLTDLQIVSWSDTLVKVALDPSMVDVPDQDNVTLVIVPAAGQPGQKSGFKFFAMRREYLLPSIPQSQVALAQITDDGGKGVPPWYSSPYQGTWYSESTQTGNTQAQVIAQGLNADQGMTAGADRNAWYRFGGGTDVYDFTMLKPGFYVSKFQIDEHTFPVCFPNPGFTFSLEVGETDYDDGFWNAQYNQIENKIHVDFAERHCHAVNGSDSSNSTYALNVWVKGPALSPGSSLWQAGVK
jgi:hypothetical protein